MRNFPLLLFTTYDKKLSVDLLLVRTLSKVCELGMGFDRKTFRTWIQFNESVEEKMIVEIEFACGCHSYS
jgi:hypothetical protein